MARIASSSNRSRAANYIAVDGRIGKLWATVLAILAWLAGPAVSPVFAQGGPENVLLVVNRESPSSMLLANHYVQLRNIPALNVLYLDGIINREFTNETVFRTTILQPVLEAIEQRGLADHIDYILYSSDFPTTINIPDSQARLLELARQQGRPLNDQSKRLFNPSASITSLTVFARQVLKEDPTFMALNANRYMRTKGSDGEYLPTRSFHSTDLWASDGSLTDDPGSGQSYYLSSILSVTRNYGMSEQEAVDWMTKTVAADGTPPAGTVFFAENPGARTAPRKGLFRETMATLDRLGVRSRTIRQRIPQNSVVAGFVAGAANLDLMESGSRFSAGSICENLTSIGGKMFSPTQLKCTEFLRVGAAGSSGCVTEPLAIAAKFPQPMIQVHYARGCTLAEAFYQSTHGPFQTLVVGDPLCRPYGKSPVVSVAGIREGDTVSGIVVAEISYGSDVPVSRTQVYLDGIRIKDSERLDKFELDTTQLADGFHELRIVAVADGLIETNARQITGFHVGNEGKKVDIRSSRDTWDIADTIAVTVMAARGSRIQLLHNQQVIGELNRHEGRIEIPASRVGRGPVRLQAIAVADGNQQPVASRPLQLTIEGELRTAPHPLPPPRRGSAKGKKRLP